MVVEIVHIVVYGLGWYRGRATERIICSIRILMRDLKAIQKVNSILSRHHKRKCYANQGNSPLDRNKDGPLVKYTITNSLQSLVPHCQLMFPKIPLFSQIIRAFLCVYIVIASLSCRPIFKLQHSLVLLSTFFCPSRLRLAPIEERKKIGIGLGFSTLPLLS